MFNVQQTCPSMPSVPSTSSMVLLEVTNLDLNRGRLQLAKALNFSVKSRQLLQLQGANGSGKSSLLRLLAGVQPIKTGTLSVCGRVAFFASAYGLRRELTVLTQLQLQAQLYGKSLSLTAAIALLKTVGLAHKGLELSARLSMGQRARLGLAFLQVSGAPIWLMDEPVNALDAQGVVLLGQMLAAHLQSGGAAVVATHQALTVLCPNLQPFCIDALCLGRGRDEGVSAVSQPFDGYDVSTCVDSLVTPALPVSFDSSASSVSSMQGYALGFSQSLPAMFALLWVLRREWAVFVAAPKAAFWPAVFHAMVLCLFPIALGSDVNLLTRVAAGLFWVSGLLACIVSVANLFEADYHDGALAQMVAAGLPMSALALGKMLLTAITQGGTLILVSAVLALQYRLSGLEIAYLLLSLALGVGALVFVTGLFSAMTLMAKQATMLVYLLALPLFVPLLVFGTAVLAAVQGSLNPFWPLVVLGALSVLCVCSVPFGVSQLIQWALE